VDDGNPPSLFSASQHPFYLASHSPSELFAAIMPFLFEI